MLFRSLVSLSDQNMHYGKNVRAEFSGSVIIEVPDKETFFIFKSKDYTKRLDGKPYFQVYDDVLKGAGEGMVHTLKDFDQVIMQGSEENGITIYNGPREFFPIEFKGDKISIPMKALVAPYVINKMTIPGTDKFHAIKSLGLGLNYFSGGQNLVNVGKVYVDYWGNERPNARMRKLIAADMNAKIGTIDFRDLESGMNREAYIQALKDSKYKSLELVTGTITDRIIDKGIAKGSQQLIGNKVYKGMTLVAKAGMAMGFIDSDGKPDKTRAAEVRIDKALVTTARKTLNNFNGAVNEFNAGEFRDVSPKTLFGLTAATMGLKAITGVDIITDDQIITSASTAISASQTYLDLNGALEKIYEAYGNQIPRGTRIHIGRRGDDAFVKITPPPIIKIRDKEFGGFKKVHMPPERLSIEPGLADKMMMPMIKEYDRLNGWNVYKNRKIPVN